jgi:hypothetical protein
MEKPEDSYSETMKSDISKVAKILTDLLERLQERIRLRAPEEIATLKEISSRYEPKPETVSISEEPVSEEKTEEEYSLSRSEENEKSVQTSA